MKYAITGILMVLLIFIGSMARSQSDNGTVAFDSPNLPSSEFQFDLDRRVIGLVMEDPTANIAPLFNKIDNLHLRNYRIRSVNFKEVVQYYEETLEGRGWDVLGEYWQDNVKSDNLHLYTLQGDETVDGIFIIVKSEDGVYLINIIGEIPKKQLGELLLNLSQIGIEIPELMSLKRPDLELATPPAPSTPESIELNPELPTIEEGNAEEKIPFSQEAIEPKKSLNWQIDGKPIHELQIQNSLTTLEDENPVQVENKKAAERANVMKVLESGSGDITRVMPVLASVLLDSSRKVSLRINEKDTKRIAIITVEDTPVTQTISILKSLRLSGSNVNQVHESISKSIPVKLDTQDLPPATRFWAGEAPIHEIRIRGNKKTSEAQIQRTLENGSQDIGQALKTLFKVMPHFEEINLQVDEEDSKYIATITVDEKPLSTDVYLGFNPLVTTGFNRVTGSEIGTNFEVGKRKEVGPLWIWNVGDPARNQTSKLFGNLSYASGNEQFHYRFGGTANLGKPYIWNLGLTAQIHRLTDAIAPELFPNYNSDGSLIYRIFGGHDYPNYYLREGVEIALRWEPVMPIHSFKLAVVAESHDSLQKSTDWSIANWKSRRAVRENPPINPGSMRSITFRYDFDMRINSVGWYNTFFMEHSNSAFGSDFDFTRYQLHLRYAYPLGKHRIRTRLLFGFSNALLPMQRQFAISGPGGLRGYPLFAPADEAEREAIPNWYRHSRYAFAGDRGFLFNIEYHYCLGEIVDWRIFNSAFVIAFLDEGQVWNASETKYTFDPSGNIGIGLQLGRNEIIWRTNVARALNFNAFTKERLLAEPGYVITSTWYHAF